MKFIDNLNRFIDSKFEYHHWVELFAIIFFLTWLITFICLVFK